MSTKNPYESVYCSHIMQFVEGLEVYKQISPLAADLAERIQTWLGEAKHFTLVEGGRYLTDDNQMPKDVGLYVRLPFPKVALQFELRAKGWYCVILAMELDEEISEFIWEHADILNEEAKVLLKDLIRNPESMDHVVMIPLVRENGKPVTPPSGVGIFRRDDIYVNHISKGVTEQQLIEAGMSGKRMASLTVDKENKSKGDVFGIRRLLYGFFHLRERMIGQPKSETDQLLTTWRGILFVASWTLADFCLTLNCTNIKMLTIPAPEKLNAKRAKNGKAPFSEIRMLTLMNEHDLPGAPKGGEHASPKFHFRRGHLRHIGNNRLVWVNSCAVGNPEKGTIKAAYQVGE